MKVVLISNHNIESVAESLLEENVDTIQAELKAQEWNNVNASCGSTYYAVIKDDDYRLWRGMVDLV